jgi:hypothetical protein
MPEWFLGVDLGQRYTVGACAIGPNGVRRNLAIKKTALTEPYRLYKKKLEHRKPDITKDLEVTPKFRTDDETNAQYFDRWIARNDSLSAFYNSVTSKKQRWDLKKAERGEFDRAVDAMLHMVGGSINQNVTSSKSPVIGIGTGEFSTQNSLHGSFCDYFLRKVASLGYRVVGLNEYWTSQKCPHGHDFTESIDFRCKYCRKCHKWFHRDIMAGENLGNVLIGMCADGSRPEYLVLKQLTPKFVSSDISDSEAT